MSSRARRADADVPRGSYPPPRSRLVVTDHHRALVAAAAEIHREQGCGRACPLRRAAGGDEAALREVVADAMRRRLERP